MVYGKLIIDHQQLYFVWETGSNGKTQKNRAMYIYWEFSVKMEGWIHVVKQKRKNEKEDSSRY